MPQMNERNTQFSLAWINIIEYNEIHMQSYNYIIIRYIFGIAIASILIKLGIKISLMHIS